MTKTPAPPASAESRNQDRALAQRAAAGDMAAFESIYQDHYRRVYSICLRMTQNAYEAEDFAQDTFVHLWRKIGSFRGDSAFTTWLHRMTTNIVLMEFRKRKKLPEHVSEEGALPERPVPGTANVFRLAIDDRIALEAAISGLPPGYQETFILHDVEGHEHTEVADIMGCSVGTSKSQLHKARVKLRKLLKKKANPRLIPVAA